ncbi:unnamed protein product [Pedinophyceae sp. YPF-701]|nr:unnamed protein product [Pedinophyceae sp. YPF-701]
MTVVKAALHPVARRFSGDEKRPPSDDAKPTVGFGAHDEIGVETLDKRRRQRPEPYRKRLCVKLSMSYVWISVVVVVALAQCFQDSLNYWVWQGSLAGAWDASTGRSAMAVCFALFLIADSAINAVLASDYVVLHNAFTLIMDAVGTAGPVINLLWQRLVLDRHPYHDTHQPVNEVAYVHATYAVGVAVLGILIQPLALQKVLTCLWRYRVLTDARSTDPARQLRARTAARIRQLVLAIAGLSTFVMALTSWLYSLQSFLIYDRRMESFVRHVAAVGGVSRRATAALVRSAHEHSWQFGAANLLYVTTSKYQEAYAANATTPVSPVEFQHPDGTVVGFDRLLEARALVMWTGLRKIVLVTFSVLLVSALFTITDMLILTPLAKQFAEVADIAAQLDEEGEIQFVPEGVNVGNEDVGLDEALRRMCNSVRRVAKSTLKGAGVLTRVAREGGTGGFTGLGLGEWEELYGRRPLGRRRASSSGRRSNDSMRSPSASGQSRINQSYSELCNDAMGSGISDAAATVRAEEAASGLQPELMGTPEWNVLDVPYDALPRAVLMMFRRLGLVCQEPSRDGTAPVKADSNLASAPSTDSARSDGMAADPPVTHSFLTPVSPRNKKKSKLPDEATVLALVSALAKQYDDNPYHNWYHAIDVCHSCFQLLLDYEREPGPPGSGWSKLDKLCVLVAALAHDLGHLGLTNDFLINTGHPLAVTYNDVSPQENGHCARLFRTLADTPETDVFSKYSAEDRAFARGTIIALIHGTDMKHHFEMVSELERLAERLEEHNEIGVLPSDRAARTLLLKATLHAADVAHLIRGKRCILLWTPRIITEFFVQGDKERLMGRTPAAVMDRTREYVPHGQLGFLDAVIRPFYTTFVRVAPWHEWIIPGLKSAFRLWLSIIREHQAMMRTNRSESRRSSLSNRPSIERHDGMAETVFRKQAIAVTEVPPRLRNIAAQYSIHCPKFAEHAAWESVAQPLPAEDLGLAQIVWDAFRDSSSSLKSSLKSASNRSELETRATMDVITEKRKRQYSIPEEEPLKVAAEAGGEDLGWNMDVMKKQSILYMPLEMIPAQALTMDTDRQLRHMVAKLPGRRWRGGSIDAPGLGRSRHSPASDHTQGPNT